MIWTLKNEDKHFYIICQKKHKSCDERCFNEQRKNKAKISVFIWQESHEMVLKTELVTRFCLHKDRFFTVPLVISFLLKPSNFPSFHYTMTKFHPFFDFVVFIFLFHHLLLVDSYGLFSLKPLLFCHFLWKHLVCFFKFLLILFLGFFCFFCFFCRWSFIRLHSSHWGNIFNTKSYMVPKVWNFFSSVNEMELFLQIGFLNSVN